MRINELICQGDVVALVYFLAKILSNILRTCCVGEPIKDSLLEKKYYALKAYNSENFLCS